MRTPLKESSFNITRRAS